LINTELRWASSLIIGVLQLNVWRKSEFVLLRPIVFGPNQSAKWMKSWFLLMLLSSRVPLRFRSWIIQYNRVTNTPGRGALSRPSPVTLFFLLPFATNGNLLPSFLMLLPFPFCRLCLLFFLNQLWKLLRWCTFLESYPIQSLPPVIIARREVNS